MKNIKKVMAMIMIVAVLFSGVVFGATELDTATITLNATVQGVHEIGVFDAEVTGTGALATGISAVAIGDINPSHTSDIVTASKYLAVRTNQKLATTVTIAINPLLASADVLAYNMVFDNEALTKTVSTTTAGSHTLTIPAGNGVRIYNFPFHFTVTTAQFTAAVPAAYSATVAFTYTAP